ncbi:transglutaminase [Amylibacter ulvae]|uniref:Transglutaminase n=1 Tax=Paramylibacter ulvae TaxID=1651968 RepID=A0ABQ3CXM5_9RHOB|nr:transglutaminase family protein [Amylibacter ulvae]GHA45471.1 transglutaminase [Amylibacter ulvae]
MKLHINHITQYAYDQPVDYALQKIRLRPYDSVSQDVSDWKLIIDGGKLEASYVDHYGNCVDLISTDIGAQNLTITATGNVITSDESGVFGKIYGRAPLWHFLQMTSLTQANDTILDMSEVIKKRGDVLMGLHDLSNTVLEKTPYKVGETGIETTAADALKIGHGVCQDHAHIFISAARAAGIPARYVSGYLKINDQVDQDASHAWAEAHIPSIGWVGFDVSNGVSPDEKYVRLAIGRDARDAAPISGMRLGNADETMIVSLQVQQ